MSPWWKGCALPRTKRDLDGACVLKKQSWVLIGYTHVSFGWNVISAIICLLVMMGLGFAAKCGALPAGDKQWA